MADQNKPTGVNWSKMFVRDNHGTASLEETLAKCEAEMRTALALELSSEVIAKAVQSVYETTPDGKYDIDSLSLRALSQMRTITGSDPVPGTESKVIKRIQEYVRGESDSFISGKGGLYHVARGKGGGVRVITEAYTVEFQKKEAAKLA